MLKGYIRPITLSDAEMVLEWRNQDTVRINMYNNEIISLSSHMIWFKSMLENSTCRYFIYERDNTPLGLLAITDIDFNNKKASWAFYSGDTTARGIGSEMEKLALSYAFDDLKLNKLCCEVLEFNASVINFHRKYGFKIEGIRKSDYFRDGKFYDIYQLALLKDEYHKNLIEPENSLVKTYKWESLSCNSDSCVPFPINEIVKNYPGEIFKLTKSCCNYFEYSKSNTVSCTASLKSHLNEGTVIEYNFYQQDKLIFTIEAEFQLDL